MTFLLSIKQKMMLSVSIGVLATLVSWRVLVHKEKQINNRYTMTTVLQTKKYVKEGRPLTEDVVEEVPIPIAYVPPTALRKKSELKTNTGDSLYSARIGLLKGEMLSKSKLFERGSLRGLAWTLSPGQTALSLKLAPEQAVAGLLQPGDAVNVYCTIDQQPNWPKDRTSLLLQRVLVLAVDRHLWDPGASVASAPLEEGLPPEQLLVTLALSPVEAARATLAADKGRLALALTSPLDSQIYSVRPLELLDLR